MTDKLFHALKIDSCASLILLSLAGNRLRDAGIVGQVISRHGERRDRITYEEALRGEFGGMVEVMGVCEVNLSENEIDDYGLKELCFFLRQDSWMRVKC
jgi:hypothetical protein